MRLSAQQPAPHASKTQQGLCDDRLHGGWETQVGKVRALGRLLSSVNAIRCMWEITGRFAGSHSVHASASNGYNGYIALQR